MATLLMTPTAVVQLLIMVERFNVPLSETEDVT
jgi:hypothetical protein